MSWLVELEQNTIIPQDWRGFAQCHASTLLALPNGDILVAYMAGGGEAKPDMAIWLSRRTNGEWLPPQRIQHRYLLAHWNPVLHRDDETGTIFLYYKVGNTVQNWYTLVSTSPDDGATWSCAQEAIADDHTPRVCVRCKLLVDSAGRWIGPVSVEAGDLWDAFVDISDDKGKTWQSHAIPLVHPERSAATAEVQQTEAQGKPGWGAFEEGALWMNDLSVAMGWDGVIQPTLWESSPGVLHALMRSTRGRIYRSDSRDGGATWCEAYATPFPNNNSGIDIVRLDGGALVLLHNPVAGNWDARSPLSASLSLDNGLTFTEPVHLETRPGEYSYPAIVASGDRLYFSYTSNRTNMICGSFGVQL